MAQPTLITLVGSPSAFRPQRNAADNHAAMNGSTRAAQIFVVLFAMLFCGIGLSVFVSGVRRALASGSTQYWGMALIGFVFSAVGFVLLAAALIVPRKEKQANRRQAENPDQPWMWREDWAQSHADSKTRPTMISAWILAVLWNLVSTPMLLLVPKQQWQPKILAVLVFPAVGVGLLIWAVRETLRWVEFGKTYYEMATVPCVIGRELRGTIQAHFPHLPEHGILIKLSCVNRIVTGSGNSRSTREKILWREEKSIPPAELYPGPTGVCIPVSFHIPLDARQTDTRDYQNSILWLLEADADVPGVDYKDIFEIPLFRTKDTPAAEETERLHPPDFACERPAKPTILVGPAAEGGTEFYFPAARNKSFAISVTGFWLLWTGAIWIQIAVHAPFIFPLFTGLFDLLLIAIALQMWFGTSRVVIASEKVRVRSGLFGGGRVQEMPFSQIVAIQATITAQQGQATGTPYYDIELTRSDGKKITLGKTVRDRHEADWLVTEMERLTGLQSKAMSAATG